ncbi:hypothetical protein VP01_747g8 [Puccinia sorghi]|uniref:RING-type domain-containing protein n=1 Tax=Puccinia sorghi TaxID=27349 RepID=A0A0L6UD86_9BASI|nr:hypothetical protein VP01_747g8 [Puccinia sorghi]
MSTHSHTLQSSSSSPKSAPSTSTIVPHLENGYNYISEPNENLLCPICRNPFNNPVMCESTDHIFCESCLIKSLEISATCPIDRLPLSLSLVVPAPKIINKLVDELLVYCPYKAQLGCAFVCQRDLIYSHLRSHHQLVQPHHLQSSHNQLVEPVSLQSVISPTISSSSPLRFQGSHQTHEPSSVPNPATNEGHRSTCPFQRFGCTFEGASEFIVEQHLTMHGDAPGGCCQFASVREMLRGYEHLEGRNEELKQQLSQSLVRQAQLKSVLEKLKASFRQLWLASQEQAGDSSAQKPSPSGAPSTPPPPPSCVPADVRRASILSKLQIPDTMISRSRVSREEVSEYGPPTHSTQPCCSSDDGSWTGPCSRMAYAVNGARLRRTCDLPPTSDTRSLLFSPIGEPSSHHLKILRVKTFQKRGDTLTPTSDFHFDHPPAGPSVPATSPSSPRLPASSENPDLIDA